MNKQEEIIPLDIKEKKFINDFLNASKKIVKEENLEIPLLLNHESSTLAVSFSIVKYKDNN